jgi:hypothetical protein
VIRPNKKNVGATPEMIEVIADELAAAGFNDMATDDA